jgi:hypothetical protein
MPRIPIFKPQYEPPGVTGTIPMPVELAGAPYAIAARGIERMSDIAFL